MQRLVVLVYPTSQPWEASLINAIAKYILLRGLIHRLVTRHAIKIPGYTSCFRRGPGSYQPRGHQSLSLFGSWRTGSAVSVDSTSILSSEISSEGSIRLMAVLVNVPHPLRRGGFTVDFIKCQKSPALHLPQSQQKDTLSKPYGDLTGSSLSFGSVKSVGRVVLSLEINLLALS